MQTAYTATDTLLMWLAATTVVAVSHMEKSPFGTTQKISYQYVARCYNLCSAAIIVIPVRQI
jgi:hypothetical protein